MKFSIANPLSSICKNSRLPAIALAVLMAGAAQSPVLGQGLDSEEAIDAIIGSDVKTDEVHQDGDIQRVTDAIANSRQSAELARKAFNLDSLEIIFVPEVSEALAKVIEENEVDVRTLRESIEGSAMFYHAIDSRSIMLTNIIAAEFGEGNDVTIFVKGTPDTADRNIETPAVE
jgi:hypothetical protein